MDPSPPRLAVDAKGYVWRVYPEHWSMAPNNPDNSPVPEPITYYTPEAERDALRDAEATLDERAHVAYSRSVTATVPWSDLAEWQREAWRCEVDPDRDPAGITRAKEAEDG